MSLFPLADPDWRAALAPALASPAAQDLAQFLSAQEAAGKRIYPPASQRMAALDLTPLASVKVVILGQDPYHGAGQAHGLAFSVPDGVRPPPSLVNIFKELQADLGHAPPAHGNLSAWARQGVLLLNTALSVEEGRAGSHARAGWQAITDACLAAVATGPQPCAFLLWGNHARQTAARIPALHSGRHGIFHAPHPSPLSAYHGWFGSKPFSRANGFLAQHGRTGVDWRLAPANPLLL